MSSAAITSPMFMGRIAIELAAKGVSANMCLDRFGANAAIVFDHWQHQGGGLLVAVMRSP
jgi:hypothetical protein